MRSLHPVMLGVAFTIGVAFDSAAQVVLNMPAPPKQSGATGQPASEAMADAGAVSMAGFLGNRSAPKVRTGGRSWLGNVYSAWRDSIRYASPFGYGYWGWGWGWGWPGFGHCHGRGHGHGLGATFDLSIGYTGDKWSFSFDTN
jgi:hypothetical protein